MKSNLKMIRNQNKVKLTIGFVFLVCSTLPFGACGRIGDPLPPEAFAPQAIEDVLVKADTTGVYFEFVGVKDDVRGQELKTMDGFQLERKVIERDSDIVDESVEYEEITFAEDLHVKEVEKLRAEARLAGKPSRTIKVDSDKLKFSLADNTVQAGRQYVYRIVPLNQDGVEGGVKKFVRVRFNGLNSEIQIMDSSSFNLSAN